MAYENLDYTHLDPHTKHTIDQLADFIRNKVYGIDVRESIAQAMEWLQEAYRVADENNEMTLKEFIKKTDLVVRLENDIDSFLRRYNDQIAGNTDIDEVIDARRPEGREAYPTLRERLDKEHQEVTAQLA